MIVYILIWNFVLYTLSFIGLLPVYTEHTMRVDGTYDCPHSLGGVMLSMNGTVRATVVRIC